jgi:hypothetical protein
VLGSAAENAGLPARHDSIALIRRRHSLVAAALGIALASGSAQAAIISGTWTFSASGFTNGFASPGSFSGWFTFSFDDSADIIDSTAMIPRR